MFVYSSMLVTISEEMSWKKRGCVFHCYCSYTVFQKKRDHVFDDKFN